MKVLAFISFFVFSIVWLIITLCAGNENATVLDPGENRVLDTSSSYFATGVSIVDDSRSIDVYYLDTKPTLGDSGSQSPILFDKTIDMGNEEYIFYAFYLNQGSTIDVSVTAQGNSGVDFYVCTSQDQCDTLIDAVEDGSYVYTYKKYFKSASGEKKKLAYGVQNDGMHYLVLNNVLARGVAVHISYEIHRTLYNLPDNATPVCAAKKEGEKTSYFEELCVINFDKSDGAVLMVAPPVKESDSDSDSGSGSGSASDSGKASSDQKDSLTESYEVQYNVLSSNWSWFLVWAACGLMTLLLILMPCSASECRYVSHFQLPNCQYVEIWLYLYISISAVVISVSVEWCIRKPALIFLFFYHILQ